MLDPRPWLVFLLPFAVYMLLGSTEPTPSASAESADGTLLAYRYYPILYTLKVGLTLGAILLVLPGYKRFPWRATMWGPIVGMAGIVVWVGLCSLPFQERWLSTVGLDWLASLGRRSAYNPFQELAALPAAWAWTFLAVRLLGLAVVVPIIEEFVLRGFLMPLCVAADWSKVPFGTVNRMAVLVALLYGVATHPGELFAAVAWFALVTWLMVKTKSLWDCVIAHSVTNLLLGVYVVLSGRWHLM